MTRPTTALTVREESLPARAPTLVEDMEFARTLADSQLLPQAYRGKVGDVLVAVHIARDLGVSPYLVLTNLSFVNGKPTWAAPFLIARANASGIFAEPLSFETTGEGATLAVTCSTVIRATGKRVSKTVSLAMAKEAGWTRNALYKSLPEQLISYRAAVFLIRLHAPQILFGLHTSDEMEDVAASRSSGPAVSYEDPEPDSHSTPPAPAPRPRRGSPEPTPPQVGADVPSGRDGLAPSAPPPGEADIPFDVAGDPLPAPSSPPAPASPGSAETSTVSEGAPGNGHHESWEGHRSAFFASLQRIPDTTYEDLCWVLESLGKDRPSATTTQKREEVLNWLRSEKGLRTFRARLAALRQRAELMEQVGRAQTAALAHVGPADTLALAADAGIALVDDVPALDAASVEQLRQYLHLLTEAVPA